MLDDLKVALEQAYTHFRSIRPNDWSSTSSSEKTGGYHYYSRSSRKMCEDSPAMQQHLVGVMNDALSRLNSAGWTSKQVSVGSAFNMYALTKSHGTVSDGGAFHGIFIKEMWVAAWAFSYASMDHNAPRLARDADYDQRSLDIARPYWTSSLTKGQGPTEVSGMMWTADPEAHLESNPLVQTAILLHAIMESVDGNTIQGSNGYAEDVVRQAVLPSQKKARDKLDEEERIALTSEEKQRRMTPGVQSTLVFDLLETFSQEDQCKICGLVLHYEEKFTVRMSRKGAWGRQVSEHSHTLDLFALLVKKHAYDVAHRLLMSNQRVLESLNLAPEFMLKTEWVGHHQDTNLDANLNLLHLIAAFPPQNSTACSKVQDILNLIEVKHPGALAAMVHANTARHENTGVSGKGYSSGFIATKVSPVGVAFLLSRSSALTSLSILSEYADVFGDVHLQCPPNSLWRQWWACGPHEKSGTTIGDVRDEEEEEEEEKDEEGESEKLPPQKLFEYKYSSYDDYGEDDSCSIGFKSALNDVSSLSLPGGGASAPAQMALSLFCPCKVEVDSDTLSRVKSLNHLSFEALHMLLYTPVDPTLNVTNVDWVQVEQCPHKICFPKQLLSEDDDAGQKRDKMLSHIGGDCTFTQECYCYTHFGDVYDWESILGVKSWSSEAIALIRRVSLPINRLDPKVWKLERRVKWLSSVEQEKKLLELPEAERQWSKWKMERPQVTMTFSRRSNPAEVYDIDPLFTKVAEIINKSSYPDDIASGMPDKFWGYRIYNVVGDSHSVHSNRFKFTEDHKALRNKANALDEDHFERLRKYLPLRQCPICNELPEYLEHQEALRWGELGDFSKRRKEEDIDQFEDLSRYGYSRAGVQLIDKTFLDSTGFFFSMKLRELFALGFRISSGQAALFNYDVICEIASFIHPEPCLGLATWNALEEGKRVKISLSSHVFRQKAKEESREVPPLDLRLNL